MSYLLNQKKKKKKFLCGRFWPIDYHFQMNSSFFLLWPSLYFSPKDRNQHVIMRLRRSLKVVIIESYLFLTQLERLLESNAKNPPSAVSANSDWCSVYDFDYAKGRWHCSSSASWHLSCSIAPLTNQILPQMPDFDQLFQVILECSALLSNMPLFSVISVV